MFSRRHPYLYFLLVFSTIVGASAVGLTLLVVLGIKSPDFEFGENGEAVGVVEINGLIADAGDTIRMIKKFRDNKSVKAIVLRIDSPGGGVGPSQEIFREVRKTVKQKKVVASLGSVAASGGLYIAVGADGIVANPGTVTGSIGVIIGYANFQQLLEKIGLVPVVVKSGPYKDIGSPTRKMSEDEKKILQDFVDSVHRQFISAIAEGRNLQLAKVEAIADGRIFSGEVAMQLGLVDRIGNLEDAIEWAGRMGGIKGKITALYPREKRFSFLKYFVDSFLQVAKEAIRPHLAVQYYYPAYAE
ncbi:MAG: signal peptide peptidase SppA [Desulfobacterales bacterium]|nr:signal peptide peptidase SppA [Desulfobacterales bacterium]